MRKKAMNYVAQVTKQELSTEKVELSVADDISKTKAFAEDIMQQISKIKAEIKEDNKLNSAIDKVIKERIKSSKNIASKAEQFDNEIQFIETTGHTFGQQMVKISDSSNTILFCADLIPTVSHIPLPYIMGYDLQPMETLKEKTNLLP